MSPDPGTIFKDQTYYCASSYRTISITVTLHSTSTVGIKCLVHCPGTQRQILILSSSTNHHQLLQACALIFDIISCSQACHLLQICLAKHLAHCHASNYRSTSSVSSIQLSRKNLIIDKIALSKIIVEPTSSKESHNGSNTKLRRVRPRARRTSPPK